MKIMKAAVNPNNLSFRLLITLVFAAGMTLPVSKSAGADGEPAFDWARTMGGTTIDVAEAMAIDNAGNVYTAGFFNGTADFDPGTDVFDLTSTGEFDIFISKLDSDGNFIWGRSMGGANNDRPNAIAVDSAGNVYTAGYFKNTADLDPGAGIFNLTSAGAYDIFISKLDSAGNFVWARSIGSSDYDDALAIALDSAGNVYATGYFNGTVDFDPGVGTFNLTSDGEMADIFVIKLDSAGDFVWARAMGSPDHDAAYALAVDGTGNVFTAGYFRTTADFDPGVGVYNLTSGGFADIFVSKLDSDGSFAWAKAMGGTTNESEYAKAIAVDTTGNVYTAGVFGLTADFDPGVGTFNLTSVGADDIFCSKLDSDGNFVWAKAIGGPSWDAADAITVDSAGNVYVAGGFTETADFDPGASISNLTSAGDYDIFVSKFDNTGNFTWARAVGGTQEDGAFAVALDSEGYVYTAGEFIGTVDFDPGAGTFNLIGAGYYDIFVSKDAIENYPPPAPANISASDGDYSDIVHLTWNASSVAASYQVYRNISDNTSGATQIGSPSSGPFDDDSAIAGTTYYYWLKACNSAGCSGFSSSDSGYRTGSIPSIPTGVSASDGTYNDKVQVSWNISSGATFYEIYRNEFNNLSGATQIGSLSSSPYDDTTANPGVTYYYWVKACNSAGCSGFSSSTSGFYISTAPGKATLILPLGNIGTNYTPTYTWNEVTESGAESAATWYYLWVNDATNKPVVKQWYEASVICNLGTCEVTPSKTLSGGQHTWWVQTWNAAGYGPWSDPLTFSTAIPTAPGKPILQAPTGNIGENYNPTYQWDKVTESGTESAATWYYLWVNGSSGNVIKQWYKAIDVCSGSTCSVTPDTTLGGGQHTWWVQAWNTAGTGPWSDAMTFSTTIPTAPGAATLLSPSGSGGSNPPVYTWNQVSNATWYYVWVDGPSGNVLKQWYTSAQANCNGSTCSVTHPSALPNGSYKWWVRTWNSVGYGPWSSEMDFSLP